MTKEYLQQRLKDNNLTDSQRGLIQNTLKKLNSYLSTL